MKRKVWVSSPAFYIITAAMLGMAIASWFWNPIAFYVELGVCILSVVAVFLATKYFHSYVQRIMQGARNALFGQDYRALRDLSLPLVIVGENEDIVWGNEAFLQAMGWAKDYHGTSLEKLIHPYTLDQLMEGNGTDIRIEDHSYTVFANRTEAGYLLYWVDDTAYKDLSREHEETRPIVAVVCFDNREELMRDASGSEDARINSEVETTLNNWAHSMGGFLKKLSGGSRFLLLTDEKNITEAKKKRFEVLDHIRNIKTADNRSATISVGIGRGASNFAESELWARQALDMALGRGGDQVAIKQESDDYEFFGGLSKGVEKRDKVRTRVIAASLSDHIKASDVVLVMGHKYSDLDAIGSAIGMWSVASKGLKKTAYVVVNRSQTLAISLINSMEAALEDGDREIFIPPSEAMTLVTPKTLLIVTDTHSPDFVESQDLLNAVNRVVVIDHHRMMVKHITNAIVFYHEPYASSASEMVAELVQYIGNNTLSRVEAEALMAGIMLDTKGFVMKCGVRTFEAASYLRRRGADTVQVKRLFSDTIDTYKAKFLLVSAAEVYGNCAIVCAQEETDNIRVVAAQAADELLAIQGVVVSFVVFPSGDHVNISARSLGDVNVQLIMEALGGGGHLTMAGTQLSDTSVKEAKARLLEVLKETLPLATKFPSVNTSRV
ncbi:MAG: DHH family phosphoesterase [Clostridiales bacterium]|nr:DHH family phosphoesterase [Clostridiales bacterium]